MTDDSRRPPSRATTVSIVVLAAVMVAYGGVWLARARTLKAWPTVEGVVERTPAAAPGGAVPYSYTVGEREYRGTRVGRVTLKSNHRAGAVNELVGKYPEGARVTSVYAYLVGHRIYGAVGEDRRFIIRGLPEGKFWVTGNGSTPDGFLQGSAEVEAGADVEITLEKLVD